MSVSNIVETVRAYMADEEPRVGHLAPGRLADYIAETYGIAYWEAEQIINIVRAADAGEDYTVMPRRNPLSERANK